MMRRLIVALVALWPALASAQIAYIAPNAPISANDDRIATTSWVNSLLTGGVSGNVVFNGNVTIGGILIDGNGQLLTNIAAPATPAAGTTRVYVDSTQKVLTFKNDAGTVGNAVVPSTCGANLFGVSISAAGVYACAQPTVSNISGFGAGVATALGNAINATGGILGASGHTLPPQGRLTLATATPVMSTTQASKTTAFYTPYVGQLIPIYDGTAMTLATFTELSVATTDTAKNPAAIGVSKVNDWCVWNDAGTLRLGHGPDWTNDTTRSAGTALVMVNGILLNAVSITNGAAAQRCTYVGTTRSDGSSQLNWVFGAAASGGTAAVLGVWNAYNRVNVGTTVTDNGASYAYTSITIRQARASAGNQISFILGLAEDSVSVSYATRIDTLAALSANGAVGFGFDSTSAFSLQNYIAFNQVAVAGIFSPALVGVWNGQLGYHTLSANEKGDNVNANTFDGNGTASLNALLRM